MNSKMVFLVLFLLGIVITMQMNSVSQKNKADEEQIIMQLEDYQNQVNSLTQDIAELKDDCSRLDKEYSDALEAFKESDSEYYKLFVEYEKEIEYYKGFAGLLNVSGAGIDIGIDDSQKVDGQYGTFLVHDRYLVEVINVLKAGGAQAIAINGQRVSAMTECICLGPSIRVNGERLFAPYHIEAIGDPQTLMDAFLKSNIYNEMKQQELIVDPIIKDKITINKYSKKLSTAISSLTKENNG